MKITKLNVRGFSHEILMIGFVVVFAVAGVGYIVASHAATCPAVSSAVSSSRKNCKPVTEPRVSLKIKCSISGITKTPKFGDVMNATLTVVNTGKAATNVFGDESVGTYGTNGKKTVLKGGPVGGADGSMNLTPGQSFTIAMPPYTVGYATKDAVKGVYSASSAQTPKYACSSIFKLPHAPTAKKS